MLGSLGVMSLGGIGAFLAYFWPRKIGTFGSKISAGTIDDIKAGDVKQFREGKFYISRFQEPALGKDVMWPCTGSASTWAVRCPGSRMRTSAHNNGIFHCPCHGSIYLRNGQNVAGPGARAARHMEITFGRRARSA